MLTAAIDAAEGHNVAIVDIPNAFIQTKLEDETDMAIMIMHGQLAELLVQVAPEIYSKFVTINKSGQTILFVKLKNALYGLMHAALLFYEQFVNDICSIGFVLNPYDPCVASKGVKGKQLTIVWHVDNLKVSHKLKEVVSKFVA